MEKTIISDAHYPKLLKEIPDSPKLLYYRGNLDALTYPLAIAVVGTRRCSEYGREAARVLVKELAQAGVTIVSGLARGIDAEAHATALEYNAPTIAVLGSPLQDKEIYPQQNVKLARRIVEANGLLLSEYEAGTPSYASHFPERNRIVAGLSHGTLVIEAPMKSGSRITARLALEYNRNIYVVPGSIFSRLNEGSHWLLGQGARCVTSASDILEDFAEYYAHQPLQKKDAIRATLNENEALVFQCIEEAPESLHIDKILQATKLSHVELTSILTLLMMEDLIKESGANQFIVVR